MSDSYRYSLLYSTLIGILKKKTFQIMNRNENRKNDYKENGFIVAELNNQVVGFCRYIDSNKFTREISDIDCELLALYVKPNLKYNGIGTKLFQFVKNDFKSKHKRKMILWCLKDNDPSKKFYFKMGGEIIKERAIEIEGKEYLEVGFLLNI